MKLLFYTATAAFLALAGIFTFYALQSPDQTGAARVVLSIDAGERSGDAALAENTTSDSGKTVSSLLSESQEQQDLALDQSSADAPSESSAESEADNFGLASGPDDSSEPEGQPQAVEAAEADNAPDAIRSETGANPESTDTTANSAPPTFPGFSVVRNPYASDAAPVVSNEPDTSQAGVENNQTAEVQAGETQPGEAPEPESTSAQQVEEAIEARLAALSEPANEPEPQQESPEPTIVVTPGAEVETPVQDLPPPSEQPSAVIEAEASPDAQQIQDAGPGVQQGQSVSVKAQQIEDSGAEAQQSQNEASQDTPSNAATDPQLKAEFDAFMAAVNEKQGQAQGQEAAPDQTEAQGQVDAPAQDQAQAQDQPEEIEVAALPPPAFPAKRPGNIPAPVRTAALSDGGSATPRIAILLRGLGRNERNSGEAVTKLPPAISMAFVPYSTGAAQQWSRKARELGHEVIVQLPFGSSDYQVSSADPEAFVPSGGADANVSRVRTVLSRFDGYNGVTHFLGGKLLQSQDQLRPILETIKSQGLIYVGEENQSHAVLKRVAGQIGLRYSGADLIIDSRPAPAAIDQALDQLVEIARKRGRAIGIGYASQTTIKQLEQWSKALSAKGVTLVPVGALAQTPGAS